MKVVRYKSHMFDDLKRLRLNLSLYERDLTKENCPRVINENYRKKGGGSLLINEVSKYAKKNDVKNIFLTTLYDNKSAIGFYEKQGFKNWAINMVKDM